MEDDTIEKEVVADPFTGEVIDDGSEPTEEEVVPEGNQPKETVKEPKVVTTDNLAEAIRNAFPKQDEKEVPKAEPKKLSPEEYDAMYKVWKPSEDFVTRLTSTDAKISNQALIEMRDKMIEQAVTMAYHISKQQLDPLQQEIGSAMSTAQELKAERSREKFITTYPELEPHSDILKMVSDQLVAGGFKPKNEKEAHEKIAQTAEALLRTVNPSFKLGGTDSKPNQQKKQTTTQTKMASTSRGGQGGASGGDKAKEKVVPGMDIFG